MKSDRVFAFEHVLENRGDVVENYEVISRRVKATMLLASTSEVYGDPEVHPQPETYDAFFNILPARGIAVHHLSDVCTPQSVPITWF